MTERKRNPEEILEDMLNKQVLFEKLEVASGVAAAAGTIALGVMKQAAVFAAAPLTIAIALSYFNRLRMGQIGRYQTHIEVAEVQRRLSSEIQSTRPLGSGEVGIPSPGQFEDAVASLAEKVAFLETQYQHSDSGTSVGTAHVEEELVQLRNHQLDLSQSLEAINQQLRGLPADAATANLTDELSTLRAQINHLQTAPRAEGAASADLESLRHEFRGLLHPVQQNLADLELRLSSHPASAETAPDVEPLRAELSQLIAPVQQQVFSLEERLATAQSAAATAAATPSVNPEALQTVHGQVHSLNEKLDNVAAQLSAEIAGFQQSVEHTQERMQTVHQQVEAVHQNISAVPVGVSPEVVHQQVQSVVGPLREQVVALEQKLGGLQVADPQASQLQSEQMVSLQNQLNSTHGMIEEMATHLTDHLTSELSKLPQMVETHVDQKVAKLQMAAPPVDKKQDALSELDAILADINL